MTATLREPSILSDEAQKALDAAQAKLAGLEEDFFAELATDYFVPRNEYDDRAAGLLPVLLTYATRVEERQQGICRRFSGDEIVLSRARKAAELLPKIRTYSQKRDFIYEFCATRKILWETLIDGVLACGYHGEDFDTTVARALLIQAELSKNERKRLFESLREKFDADSFKTRRAARYLLSQAFDTSDTVCDWNVVHFVVASAAKHSERSDTSEWVRLIALQPPKKTIL